MAETTLPKLRVSKKEARQKLQTQIEKGQLFYERLKNDQLDKVGMEANSWSAYNINLLRKLFDTPAPVDEYTKFCYSPLTVQQIKNILNENPYLLDIDRYQVVECRAAMKGSINSLKTICDQLELYDELSEMPQSTFGNDVFIIHGRDEAAKHAMARFVERLGLKPIILDEQPDAGLTIIEKLEREAKNVGFAIALLTPDDVGALKDEADDQPKPRARQNVILELGYFMGKLGRKKVCLLIKGELENPSDLDGILYVPMNSPDGWQLQLAREMRQAGLPIDLNQLA